MGLVEADRSKSDGGISHRNVAQRMSSVSGMTAHKCAWTFLNLHYYHRRGNPLDSDTTRVTRTVRGTTGLSHPRRLSPQGAFLDTLPQYHSP